MDIALTKKRGRLAMTPSPIHRRADVDPDEYDRAVSFLREFHARRVGATTHLHHLANLDAILENAESFEDMMCSDFSSGLSVGSSGKDHPMKRGSGASGGLSRMKRATTSRCLLDLGGGSSSVDVDAAPASSGGADEVAGCCFDQDEGLPVTKRHRIRRI